MNDTELSNCLEAAVTAAKLAAAVLEEWRPRFSVREKGRSDLVTEADVASQTAIQTFLASRFPDHRFIGEEEVGLNQRPEADSQPTWIVDPIDGTTNYVHDVPQYCISLGLMVAREMVVGVIFEPRHKELFRASKGQGAWLDQRRLHVSATNTLEQSLMSVGFSANLEGKQIELDDWNRMAVKCQALRRTGSTALNMAYVAAGRFEGFWARDSKAWDVAGGEVLIRESGGQITQIHSTNFDSFTPGLVASNGKLHGAIQECLG